MGKLKPRQGTLETMVINLSTWEKATWKSPGHSVPLHKLGLCRSEQLLWLVARGLRHGQPSTPTPHGP